MNRNLERAKELLPAIVLTVLSMIQALALELFWSKVTGTEYLWHFGWDAIIGWLQLFVMLMGILLIWIIYVSFVLRFSWLPSIEDTVIPFFIGLLEFGMIDLMHSGSLGLWFILLAAVFGLATASSHSTLRRARQDPQNAYFFRKMEPASWRDYRLSITICLTFVLSGVFLWAFGEPSLFAVGALLLALAALTLQFLRSKHYWMHSLSYEEPDSGEQDASPPG